MKKERLLLFTLSALSLLTALSIDIYLPSVGAIASDFGVSAQAVSVSLSLFLFSYAFGQLAYGPLSDRFGRVPTLFAGLTVYLLSSLLATVSISLNAFYLARLFQGLSACCGPITSFALIGDLFTGEKAAKVDAYVDMGVSLAPLLAPLLGAALTSHFGWRANFVVLSVTALALIAVCHFLVPETKPKTANPPPLKTILASYGRMLQNAEFRKYAAINSLTFAALMSFISLSPYLFMTMLKATPAEFSRAFTLNSAMLLLGSFITAKTTERIGLKNSLRVGLTLLVVGGSAMAGLALCGVKSPYAILVPSMIATLGMALNLPNSTAGALSLFKGTTGTCSALLGFLRFSSGGILGSAVAWSTTDSALPLALAMGGCGALGLLTFVPPKPRRLREMTTALLC